MKNLDNAEDLQEILGRVGRLTPQSQRVWGTMNVHQMICHLSDAKRMAMGERAVASRQTFLYRYVMRYGALYLPVTWPQGVPTTPEADQQVGGTPPTEFEGDRTRLLALIDSFRSRGEFRAHPLFGTMSRWEWMRCGYLHNDHHLRQFGL